MADNTVQVDPALLQRMVRFIKGAGARLEKMAADREQAKAAAPIVVDELVKQGLVGDEQKAAALRTVVAREGNNLGRLRTINVRWRPTLIKPTRQGPVRPDAPRR